MPGLNNRLPRKQPVSRWSRTVLINSHMFRDPRVGLLPPAEGWAKFEAAILYGEENEISKYIKPDRGLWFDPDWPAIRAAVFERDDYTCQYCGARGVRLECDHVQPASLGGSNDRSHLVTACFECNRSKGSKTLEEWQP